MVRKRRDEQHDAEEPSPDAVEPEVVGDSSFEAAQQMLQAAVAEIRGWEPSPEAVELGTVGPNEVSAHRRWRRRVHTDTGEHAAVFADAESELQGVADAAFTGRESAEQELTPEAVLADAPDDTPLVSTRPDDDVPSADNAALIAAGAHPAELDADHPSAEAAANGRQHVVTEATVAPAKPLRRSRRRAAGVAGVAAGASDDLEGLAGATAEPRTPRRRDRGSARPQTISSPTADYVLTIEQPAAEPGGPADDGAPTGSGRGRRILVGSLAAIVAVGVIAFAATRGGSDDEVASPPATVQPRLAFAPVTTPEGVTVTRVWKLQGTDGDSLRGRLAFTNPTSAPVTTTFTEVFPKSLAPSVSVIRFDPQPVVVKADPIVRYTVTVDPGDTFVATYTVAVSATGAKRERLLKWAEDLRAEVGTTTTTLPPTTTTVAPPATTPVAPPVTPPITAPATAPPTTAPPTTTTAAPPTGTYYVAVFNNSPFQGTFTFSNGVVRTVGAYEQASSELITVPAGPHSVTLTNGTTQGIQCSSPGSTASGRTANIDVPPGGTANCIWTAVP